MKTQQELLADLIELGINTPYVCESVLTFLRPCEQKYFVCALGAACVGKFGVDIYTEYAYQNLPYRRFTEEKMPEFSKILLNKVANDHVNSYRIEQILIKLRENKYEID